MPRRLAWAATVVLALGAGWMANSIFRAPAATTVSDGPAVNGTRGNAPAEAPADAQAQAESQAQAGDAANVGGTSSAAASPAVARTEAARTEAARADETSRASDHVAAAGQAALAGQAAAVAPAPAPAPAPASAPAPAPASAPVITADRTALIGRDQAAAKSDVTGNDAAESDARAPDDVTLRLVSAGVFWQPMTADSAYALHGGSLVRAEGLAVIDYARSGVGSSALLRVRQRGANGDTIDVVQTALPPFAQANRLRRAPAPPAGAPPLGPPPPQALAQASGLRVQVPLASGIIEPTVPGARRRYYVRMRSEDGRDVVIISGAEAAASAVVLEVVRRGR